MSEPRQWDLKTFFEQRTPQESTWDYLLRRYTELKAELESQGYTVNTTFPSGDMSSWTFAEIDGLIESLREEALRGDTAEPPYDDPFGD